MDTTTILILALRALLETLSLAEYGVSTLGDDDEAHPAMAINSLLAGLGSEERVYTYTTLTEAWLVVERTIRKQTALHIDRPLEAEQS